jgi:hypothetical protein
MGEPMPRVIERGKCSGPGGSRLVDSGEAGVGGARVRGAGGADAARRGVVGGVGWGVRFGVGVRTTTLGTSTSAWIAGGSTAMQTAEEEAEPELSEELLDAGVG